MRTADMARGSRARTDGGRPSPAPGRRTAAPKRPTTASGPATATPGGHGWRRSVRHDLEMAGAMLAPALALLPLLWVGVLSGPALLALEHLAMLPLMLLVMLRRRAEHGAPTHG
jgi:hypothetical protein